MSLSKENEMSKDPVSRIGIASGVGTFEKLLERSEIFVDKSLFISAFMGDNNETILTTYPRRSGKSMNMRMLQSFFRIEVDEKGNQLPEAKKKFPKYFVGGEIEFSASKREVLKPLQISHVPDIMEDQGQFPVIYVDMKDAESASYHGILEKLKKRIRECFEDHDYLRYSDKLSESDKNDFQKYYNSDLSKKLTSDEVEESLKLLSKLLKKHFSKEVIILIDEYDAAINYAYTDLSDDEFKSVVQLFRQIYGSALKNNSNLKKALVTGVMRIAKANIFSGINNFGEYNICSSAFAPYYGFTQEEVDELLSHYSMPEDISRDMKKWYNGYVVGRYSIYNTWSVVKCINNYLQLIQDSYYRDNPVLLRNELLQSYWEASGNVDFIKKLFKRDVIKRKVDALISGKSTSFKLHESITSDDFAVLKEMTNLRSNYDITQHGVNVIFSYLMMGGYLTFSDSMKRTFKLPNHEIRHEFQAKMLEYYHAKYKLDEDDFQRSD